MAREKAESGAELGRRPGRVETQTGPTPAPAQCWGRPQPYWCCGGFPDPHLCHGLEQRQAEPLEEGEGPDAARHLEGGHGGDVGLQVAGDLVEDLGLVEIQFSLKEQRESGSDLQGAGTGAVPGW